MAAKKKAKAKKSTKKSKAKKSAKKSVAKKAKKPAKKSKKAVKAAAGASARAGATKKAAPAKKAKTAKKKKKQVKGEGDYAASRAFLKDQSSFVARNKARIPAMGKDAEKALEGPQGNELRDAEAEAAGHSRDTFGA